MQGLNYFAKFDTDAFFKGKVFSAQRCPIWQDYNTKATLGTRVECVIIEDKTEYPKDGIGNRYEKITFKVPREVSIPSDSIVVPVNPVATIYGDHRDQLSVKCDDVKIVTQNGKT